MCTVHFSQKNYTGVEIGNGFEDILKGKIDVSKDRLNWYMAMNGLVYGTQGNVIKTGNKYAMDLTFEIKDYYDWADINESPRTFPLGIETKTTLDNSVFVVKTINETTLNKMNKAGMGKNFESYGSFTIHVTWEDGDGVEEAVIT